MKDISMAELITLFQTQFPELVSAMHQSTHHFNYNSLNPYHLEGDVWGHTLMVCLMAQELKVSNTEKMACLLHDVGKPIAREENPKNERVSFFGHEGLSVYQALHFMFKQNLCDKEIRKISELISLHTELFKTAYKPEDIKKRFLGNKPLLEGLINVAICDSYGRFFDNKEKPPFPRDPSFWDDILKSIEPLPLIQKEKQATLLVGPPLSGKSTWTQKNVDLNSSIVISRDQAILDLNPDLSYNESYRKLHDTSEGKKLLSHEFEKIKRDAIKSGKNLVFDLTHMSKKARRRSIASLPKEYKTKALVFLTPLDVLFERNELRAKDGKHISQEVILKMIKAYTCPMYDEVDEIEYIISRV